MKLMPWVNDSIDENDLTDEAVEQVHLLADEFIHLVVGILLERNHRHVAEITYDEELKNRVLHLLCTGELSHSEVVKGCHVDEDKHEVVIEQILSTIADRKTDKKDTSRKVYHLKDDHMQDFNPFHYFYTREQRDQAAEKVKSGVVPPKNLPKLRPLFENLTRLSCCIPVLKLISVTLKRCQKSTGPKFAVINKHLHKVLYIIIAGYNDDLAAKKAVFTKAADKLGIPELLDKIQPSSKELRSLKEFCIDRSHEARSIFLGKKTASDLTASPSTSASSNAEDEKRKKAKEAAAERKAKIMAQMNAMQNKFIKKHATEYDNVESKMDTSGSSLEAAGKRTNLEDDVDVLENPKAVGPLRSASLSVIKDYTCILCQEQSPEYVKETTDSSSGEDDQENKGLVFAAHVTKSTVLSQVREVKKWSRIRFNA